MKGFYNVIAGEKSVCIMLYGEISDWGENCAAEIVKDILEAEAAGKTIDVRINSLGGEVFAGIAIFNALRNSKADITIYIDCIAASAASFIAACGKPVKMSRYARLMIHRISGGAFGQVDDLQKAIDQMTALENTLCQIYAERTGMSVEDIQTSYFDGSDHWLSADEALRLKFVDDIYDDEGSIDTPTGDDPVNLCNAYTQRYLNQIHKKNMLNLFQKLPAFANCQSEDAVMTRVTELVNRASTADALQTQLDTLTAENTAYKTAEENRKKAEIKNLLNAAEADERIRKEQREGVEIMLNADREKGEAYLKSLKPKKRIVNVLNPEQGSEKGAWERRMEEIENNLKNK